MIHIKRLTEPEILIKNKEKWTEKFINSKNKRPLNSQYGHKKVREQLDSMSFYKCFYCENKLKGNLKEIDHYIEISERKDLTFEWNNLYLSCNSCNKKLSNKTIPNLHTLNPCIDSDEEIMKHLTFDDEQITSVSGSEKGLRTIQKYKLDSINQDHNRRNKHRKFKNYYEKILLKMIKEKRTDFSEEEIQFLISYTHKDKPYSLMFKILLSKTPIFCP